MSERIYVFKTTDSDYEKFFKEGICFLNSNFSMKKDFDIVASEEELVEYLPEIKSSETAYVIKIPEEYMTVSIQGDYRVFPYPLLFERQMYNAKNKTVDYYPVLVPAVVSFMFNHHIGIVVNPNYNTIFNPNGLKYTKEQLESVSVKAPRYYSEYEKRNNGDCKELFSDDCVNKSWAIFKTVYGTDESVNPFPAAPLSTFTFEPSKDKKKKLNNNKGKKKKRQFFEE